MTKTITLPPLLIPFTLNNTNKNNTINKQPKKKMAVRAKTLTDAFTTLSCWANNAKCRVRVRVIVNYHFYKLSGDTLML